LFISYLTYLSNYVILTLAVIVTNYLAGTKKKSIKGDNLMAWNIDATHSQATFSVKHMMISTVRGHFDVLSGQLNIDEEHPENSWVEAEADTASVNTRDPKRDGHLRSPDFFDSEQYPKITFKSSKVEPIGNQEYRVTGNLTMHGVTKEEVFHAEYAGQLPKDLFGLQRAAFTVKGTINRKDYGLN